MPRRPFAELLCECDDIGLLHVELSSGAGESEDVAMVAGRHHTMQFLVHNYFPAPTEPFVLNLADQDATILQKSIALCERAIDLSAAFGAPFYSVHAGFRATFDPASLGRTLRYDRVWDYDIAYGTFVRSISDLLAYGTARGVAILVEPNVLAPFNLTNGRNEVALICEPWEVTRLMADVANPHLGILLDTGHLRVTAQTLGYDRVKFVDEAAPFIRALHVHDNDGNSDAHLPVQPGSWVLDILRRREFAELPLVDEAKFESLRAMLDHVRWLSDAA